MSVIYVPILQKDVEFVIRLRMASMKVTCIYYQQVANVLSLALRLQATLTLALLAAHFLAAVARGGLAVKIAP